MRPEIKDSRTTAAIEIATPMPPTGDREVPLATSANTILKLTLEVRGVIPEGSRKVLSQPERNAWERYPLQALERSKRLLNREAQHHKWGVTTTVHPVWLDDGTLLCELHCLMKGDDEEARLIARDTFIAALHENGRALRSVTVGIGAGVNRLLVLGDLPSEEPDRVVTPDPVVHAHAGWSLVDDFEHRRERPDYTANLDEGTPVFLPGSPATHSWPVEDASPPDTCTVTVRKLEDGDIDLCTLRRLDGRGDFKVATNDKTRLMLAEAYGHRREIEVTLQLKRRQIAGFELKPERELEVNHD